MGQHSGGQHSETAACRVSRLDIGINSSSRDGVVCQTVLLVPSD
jgi:hypothetical protein